MQAAVWRRAHLLYLSQFCRAAVEKAGEQFGVLAFAGALAPQYRGKISFTKWTMTGIKVRST